MQLYISQNSISEPPSLYDTLLLPKLAPAETVARHFRSNFLLCHPDKGGRKVYFKFLVEAKKNKPGDEEARKIYYKRGAEAAHVFLSSEMDSS